jgi:large subunit ribosomal protein L21
MSQFIIEAGTKQYMVEPGKKINVDRINEAAIDSVIDIPVLFGFGDTTPSTIKAKVIAHIKGTKIRVVKFRSKSNYHKVSGFRPFQTTLEIIG